MYVTVCTWHKITYVVVVKAVSKFLWTHKGMLECYEIDIEVLLEIYQKLWRISL